MIIGYVENGEVRVYENIDNVLSEWGKYPTDLASEVIILYDHDGTWLEPVLKYVPRTWYRWYKKLDSVELKIADGKTYQDSLGYLLECEALSLKENNFVSSLEELKSYTHMSNNSLSSYTPNLCVVFARKSSLGPSPLRGSGRTRRR